MNDAGYVEAGGELSVSNASGKNYGKFGTPGAFAWQRNNGTSWVTIMQATICNYLASPGSSCGSGNGGWTFTGSLPDWTVSHG